VRETSHGGKLSAPIDVRLEPGKVIQPDVQEVLIKVTCSVPVSSVVIRAETAEGLNAIDPDMRWEFVEPPGSVHQIKLPIRLVDAGAHRLLVAATITLQNHEQQSLIDSFLFNLDVHRPKGDGITLLPGSRLIKGPDGHLIQETPGRNQ